MKFNFEIFKKTKEKVEGIKDWYLQLNKLFEEEAEKLYGKMEDGFKNFGEKIKGIDYKRYKNIVTTSAFVIGALMPNSNKEIIKTTNTDLGGEKTEQQIDIKEIQQESDQIGSQQKIEKESINKTSSEVYNPKTEDFENITIEKGLENEKEVFYIAYKDEKGIKHHIDKNGNINIGDTKGDFFEEYPDEITVKEVIEKLQENINNGTLNFKKNTLEENYPNWGNQ